MMTHGRKKRAIAFLMLFVMALGTTWLWLSYTQQGKKYKNILSAAGVIGILKYRYYQPLDVGKLWDIYFESADLKKITSSLGDPYTRFLDKNEFRQLREESEGSYVGVGIQIQNSSAEALVISEVFENTPAAEGGLLAGDRIIEVNGSLVADIGSEAATAQIRGKSGTKVDLRIARMVSEQNTEMDVTLERRDILLPTVKLEIKNDEQIGAYALLQISQFSETTGDDLEQELSKAQAAGANGIILDLRGNPGGSLNAAVDVAGAFLPDGSLVIKALRQGRTVETLRVRNSNKYTNLPMVVLANEWSASASEIVAGALKDHNRAILLGTHTFGKDLIQEVIGLPSGSGLTVTIANYRTPSGVDFHKKGIFPDKTVEIPGAMNKMLETGDSADYLKMQKMQETEALKLLREQQTTDLAA